MRIARISSSSEVSLLLETGCPLTISIFAASDTRAQDEFFGNHCINFHRFSPFLLSPLSKLKLYYAAVRKTISTDRNAPIEKIEIWKIREAEFDVQVAVRVEDGLVQEVRSNTASFFSFFVKPAFKA